MIERVRNATMRTRKIHMQTTDQPKDITDGSLYASQYLIQPSIAMTVFASKIAWLKRLRNACGKRALYLISSLLGSPTMTGLPVQSKKPKRNGSRSNHIATNLLKLEANIIFPPLFENNTSCEHSSQDIFII